MKATGTHTKKSAVEACMRQTIELKNQTRILGLAGKVVWRGHDDDWFASDEEIREKHRKAAEASTKASGSRLPAEAGQGSVKVASSEW